MKVRRFIWLVTTIIVILVALALFSDLFGIGIPGLQLIRFTRVTEFSTSSITLESVRNLYAFNTVRSFRRVVFPYDYLPHGVSMNAILRKLRASDTTVRDTLTDEEYRFYQTFNLATDVNLSTTGGTFDFVVMTLVITAGFDLSAGTDAIEIRAYEAPDGTEARRAVVTLAPATITDVSVEDIDRNDYPYPDASLDPDGWRRVTDYVRGLSVSEDVRDEILGAARENAEGFLRGVLTQAGFTEVEFEPGS